MLLAAFVNTTNVENGLPNVGSQDTSRDSFDHWYSGPEDLARSGPERVSFDDPLLRVYAEHGIAPTSRMIAAASVMLVVIAVAAAPFSPHRNVGAVLVAVAAASSVIAAHALTLNLRSSRARVLASTVIVWAAWTTLHVTAFHWAAPSLAISVPLGPTMLAGIVVGALVAADRRN